MFNLAWNKTKGAWQFVASPFNSAMDATSYHLNKYFPKTTEMIGQGIKNITDTASQGINHVRSRISGMNFLRPQFKKPTIEDVIDSN